MPFSRLRRSAGFTLTEVLFSAVVGSVVIAACTGLFFTVGQRLNTDSPRSMAVAQASMLAEQIDSVASRSVDVTFEVVTGRQRIEFKVPNTGTDIDGDGIMDTMLPGTIAYDGKTNMVSATNYQLVDFYWSDSTGTGYTVSGTAPNQVQTWSDGASPWRGKGNSITALASGGGGMDTSWSWVGDRPKYNLIYNVFYAYDGTSHVLTYTIQANVKNITDTQPTGTEQAENQTNYVLTRSVWLRYKG